MFKLGLEAFFIEIEKKFEWFEEICNFEKLSRKSANLKNFNDKYEIFPKNNPHEIDALLKAKAKLEETMPDLEVIQGMTNVEYDSIDISWGLGKWLSCDVKTFMKKK